MIEKINEDIKIINEKIESNDSNINKLFTLLDEVTKQRTELSSKIETLQLANQSYRESIEKLQIVKEYIEEKEQSPE